MDSFFTEEWMSTTLENQDDDSGTEDHRAPSGAREGHYVQRRQSHRRNQSN